MAQSTKLKIILEAQDKASKEFFGICVTHDPGLEREKGALERSVKALKLKKAYFVTRDVSGKDSVPIYRWAFYGFSP